MSYGGLFIVSKLKECATMKVSLKKLASNRFWKLSCSIVVNCLGLVVDHPDVFLILVKCS